MTFASLPVQSLLSDHGLKPKKGLGQNFLVDENYLERITSLVGLTGQELILEIGAGIGGLTRHLAAYARRVVAVELDTQLIPLLKKVMAPFSNTDLVHGDILSLNPADLSLEPGYLVAANIPYYITSSLLRHLLESAPKPSRLVLTIQQEVAERICAQPGRLSLLALSVQVYGSPQVALRIPAGAFYPKPKVDSATLLMDLLPQPRIPEIHLDDFFTIIKTAFSQRRKMLHNTLKNLPGFDLEKAAALLKQADVNPQLRPQALGFPDWLRLVDAYHHTTR
jgi:16S rRNA (adenine1518-N6/adenine1519-N6)-dimethyltransferase